MTERERQIIDIIHREVKPALGCTEPIAVALAVAKAVEIITENCPCAEGWRLGADFRLDVAVSANILKNGMGVGIPGTGMVGLAVAAALGAVCGDSSRGLEVLAALDAAAVARAKELVDRGRVRISVYNTGRPVPEEDLDRIWDKFYKVDKARTREYGGSGVGLSIVKAIMDSMNGAYGVNNTDDGVIFWFELEEA